MKLAEVALASVLGLLIWSDWQEWRLNQNDAIEWTHYGTRMVAQWQCGQLKQKMADLNEHSAELAYQYRGESPVGMNYYLQREWRQQGCDR